MLYYKSLPELRDAVIITAENEKQRNIIYNLIAYGVLNKGYLFGDGASDFIRISTIENVLFIWDYPEKRNISGIEFLHCTKRK